MPSLKKRNPEELELILVHRKPRNLLEAGTIPSYDHYYQASNRYSGRGVWTKLKGRSISRRLCVEARRVQPIDWINGYHLPAGPKWNDIQ